MDNDMLIDRQSYKEGVVRISNKIKQQVNKSMTLKTGVN